MGDLPRLNSVIRAFEAKVPAFASFATADVGTAMSFRDTEYDNIVFEMEHQPWDALALRDSLQYLLDRKAIASSGSVASTITPFVRVPANGSEMNQFLAKQALDMGCYGIVWPHIATVDEARAAVAACRYPPSEGFAQLRTRGPAWRQSDRGGPLLGRLVAGLLRPRRRLAPRSERRNSLCDHD